MAPKIDPGGSEMEPRAVKNGLPEASGGLLVARSASGGRSGRKRGSWKIAWRALGTVFRLSWRILGPFWVDLPPPRGGPGRVPEGIFEGFFGTSRARGKN